MSVDYMSCHNCGETFPDCGEYVSCESCGTAWCSDECAKEEGYIELHCKKWDVYGYDDLDEERKIRKCNYKWCDSCPEYVPDSCKYCRGEDYEDSELLDKALELLEMTREDLINLMNKK